MFERFTEQSRRVVVLAQEEARMLGHNHIGSEHLLLGLLHEQGGTAADVLASAGITVEAARSQVEELAGPGDKSPTGHIPFTQRAKKILELSLREALEQRKSYIGTEHILLALMRDADGMGARVLERLGGSLPALRQQVLEAAKAARPARRRTGNRARDVGRGLAARPGRLRTGGPRPARRSPGSASCSRRSTGAWPASSATSASPPTRRLTAGFRGLLASVDRHLANIERHLGISAEPRRTREADRRRSQADRGGVGAPVVPHAKINCWPRRWSISSAALPPSAKDFVMSWRSAPAPGWARRYPVLAIRDFRLLLVDRLLAPFSVGFSLVGVSFAVLKVTGSTADLSYVIAAQTAPMLVFSLVSGVFADRFRPQRVIMAGNLAVVVGEGVFGLLMLVTGHPPLWAMIGLEAVNGIGGAVFYPASQALLPQLVPDALLQEASSISRLAMNMGQMTGAAVAGVLVAVGRARLGARRCARRACRGRSR